MRHSKLFKDLYFNILSKTQMQSLFNIRHIYKAKYRKGPGVL